MHYCEPDYFEVHSTKVELFLLKIAKMSSDRQKFFDYKNLLTQLPSFSIEELCLRGRIAASEIKAKCIHEAAPR